MKRDANEFKKQLRFHIRARYPLIYLQSFEESRVLDMIKGVSEETSVKMPVWSRTRGFQEGPEKNTPVTDPLKALSWIEEFSEPATFVLLDFHFYFKDPTVLRKIRDIGRSFKTSRKTVLFISPVDSIPPEISKEMTVLDVPLPSREEIRSIVRDASRCEEEESKDKEGIEETLINASSGLTVDEIENAFAKSLVSSGKLDAGLIQDEKRQIVRKSGILEFIDAKKQDLPDVGGLEPLLQWLEQRAGGFTKDAKEIGLPLPKGVLLVGVPGCGKSLTAVTIARLWEMPLLRLDLGRVFSGLVGSSEGNLRKVIQTAEAVSPCILWVDEIEKGLSGSSKGNLDGGTSSRVFGTLLTWLQEKRSSVFLVATANDVSSLPPEFLRKGRFDEIFFIDLPDSEERLQILKNIAQKYGWTLDGFQLDPLLDATDGYSGSEIEQILVDARYRAFFEKRQLEEKDLVTSAQQVVPLSRMMKDQLQALREWASGRARFASKSRSAPSATTRGASSFQMRAKSMETV